MAVVVLLRLVDTGCVARSRVGMDRSGTVHLGSDGVCCTAMVPTTAAAVRIVGSCGRLDFIVVEVGALTGIRRLDRRHEW